MFFGLGIALRRAPAVLDHRALTAQVHWNSPGASAGSVVNGLGVHILRHSAAKLRRDAGETVESVSAFLDHSSLAVTTTYLRRLEGTEDGTWGRVAEAIGV